MKKIVLFIVTFVCILFPSKIMADGSNFTVQPILGSNQQSNDSYYFLKTDSNGTYHLEANVQNFDKKNSQSFKVSVINSTTSNSGSIDYSPNDQKLYKINNPLLTNMIVGQKEQTLTLKPNESKNVSFTIKVPKSGFEGMILGSVYVLKDSQVNVKNKIGFTNKFAMSIPVLMEQNNFKKFMPDMSIKSAKVSNVAGQKNIEVQVLNHSPIMFGNIKIKAWVSKRNEDKQLITKNVKNYAMSPRGIFTFSIPDKKNEISSGKYTYHVILKSGQKSYTLNNDFEISTSDNAKVNKQLIRQTNNMPIYIILVILLIIIVAVTAYIVGRRRNEKN